MCLHRGRRKTFAPAAFGGCCRAALNSAVRFHVHLRSLLLIVLLGGLSVSVARERSVFVLDPAKGGSKLLDQCSRRTPAGVDGFWTPSPQDIAQLESLLPAFLTADASGKSVLPLERYHRQYLGFLKGGKRFIYGNFYRVSTAISSIYDESTQPVLVCDGGASFWGVVFAVESKTFLDLAFNGLG